MNEINTKLERKILNDTTEIKKCNKCSVEMPLSCYHKDKQYKSGFCNTCKNCYSLKNREYREKYRAQLKKKKSEHYFQNKKEISIKKSQYNQLNREKRRIRDYNYQKYKLETDDNYKLRHSLRSRMRIALKNHFKSGSAVRDLGCTITELKNYLESKFQPGMTWDNHGKWHIDHIKPLASFDLSDRKQFLEACHYTNLQPLWAIDNLIKGKSIIV